MVKIKDYIITPYCFAQYKSNNSICVGCGFKIVCKDKRLKIDLFENHKVKGQSKTKDKKCKKK